MIRKRLYLQIYLTIILSLVMVVLAAAMAFWMSGDDDYNPGFNDLVIGFTMNVLPDASLPHDQQAQRVDEILEDLDVDFSLFGINGDLITSYGLAFSTPEDIPRDGDWDRYHQGDGDEHRQGWVTRLPDGRIIVVGRETGRDTFHSVLRLIFILGAVALGIGLAAYPFVRKLTRRLEDLKSGVVQFGDGDLKTRIHVEGQDEVAALAGSFNQTIEQIEKLVTSHKTLLANASHELRTPLSRIRLGLEMYHESGDEKRLIALRADIEELDGLIEEILLMSRLDSASTQLVMEDVELLALIEAECAHYNDVSIEGQAHTITGNKRLLQRVIRNLVGNAFKHGAPPVHVHLRQDASFVMICVTDHGHGISDADKAKVFERFYRGADRQNVEGYGLGLPLVKQIIEAHNGSIELLDAAKAGVDRQNTGVTVCVRLPNA